MAFDLGVWNGMSDAERLKDMLRVIEERDRIAAEHHELAVAYEVMRAERDRLVAELAEVWPLMKQAEAQCVRLAAELSAARADAERYRWLRSRMFSRAVPYAVGTALDQEIDAARATDSAGGPQS